MPPESQPPVDAVPRDNQLGEQLERYLDALAADADAVEPASDSEVRQLQPVVKCLHQLAGYLAGPLPETLDLPPTRSYLLAEPPIAPAAVEQPAQIGKYEIKRSLGRGGQAFWGIRRQRRGDRHVVCSGSTCRRAAPS